MMYTTVNIGLEPGFIAFPLAAAYFVFLTPSLPPNQLFTAHISLCKLPFQESTIRKTPMSA